MILQSMELKRTGLPNNPSIKLGVLGHRSLEETLTSLDNLFDDSTQITDLKQAEYLVDGKKTISIYTSSDDWDRIFLNTKTKHITQALEDSFIERINRRLVPEEATFDLKKARLILEGSLSTSKIVTKLLKDKQISVNPPIPEEAEKLIVRLKKMRVITKTIESTKRECYSCYKSPGINGHVLSVIEPT